MTTKTKKRLRDIEGLLLRGESVTTGELKRAHELYGRLREDLVGLGERWHFAFVEANRLWTMTRQYLEARGVPIYCVPPDDKSEH